MFLGAFAGAFTGVSNQLISLTSRESGMTSSDYGKTSPDAKFPIN
jgi:hypothetical protein